MQGSHLGLRGECSLGLRDLGLRHTSIVLSFLHPTLLKASDRFSLYSEDTDGLGLVFGWGCGGFGIEGLRYGLIIRSGPLSVDALC